MSLYEKEKKRREEGTLKIWLILEEAEDARLERGWLINSEGPGGNSKSDNVILLLPTECCNALTAPRYEMSDLV
jgi:hypothetical protein